MNAQRVSRIPPPIPRALTAPWVVTLVGPPQLQTPAGVTLGTFPEHVLCPSVADLSQFLCVGQDRWPCPGRCLLPGVLGPMEPTGMPLEALHWEGRDSPAVHCGI